MQEFVVGALVLSRFSQRLGLYLIVWENIRHWASNVFSHTCLLNRRAKLRTPRNYTKRQEILGNAYHKDYGGEGVAKEELEEHGKDGEKAAEPVEGATGRDVPLTRMDEEGGKLHVRYAHCLLIASAPAHEFAGER